MPASAITIPPARLAFVALGSNLGDSAGNIRRAFRLMQELSDHLLRVSSLWESTPVDCPPGSPQFINAAVALQPRTSETPESLLEELQALEIEFGRRPKTVLNEPRPLDLDLIAFGAEVRASSALTLPHPRAHLRLFVLAPLAEINPELVLPGQSLTVRELVASLASDEVVRRLGA